MVRKVSGWTDIIVRACLEGMGEFDEDETEISDLKFWLWEDVSFFLVRCICSWIDDVVVDVC
jgi:hypothetical protein